MKIAALAEHFLSLLPTVERNSASNVQALKDLHFLFAGVRGPDEDFYITVHNNPDVATISAKQLLTAPLRTALYGVGLCTTLGTAPRLPEGVPFICASHQQVNAYLWPQVQRSVSGQQSGRPNRHFVSHAARAGQALVSLGIVPSDDERIVWADYNFELQDFIQDVLRFKALHL